MLNFPSLHHDCCCAHRSCSVVLGYMIKTHNNILLIGSNRDTSNYDDASMEISNSIGYHDLDDIQIYHGPLNQIKSLCKSNLGCPAPRFFGVPWCRDPQPPGLNLHVFRSACVFFTFVKSSTQNQTHCTNIPNGFVTKFLLKQIMGHERSDAFSVAPKDRCFMRYPPTYWQLILWWYIYVYIYINIVIISLCRSWYGCMTCMSQLIEDSGGKVIHPMARRLGSVSGRNNSRDWWRALNGGPVSWYGWHFFQVPLLKPKSKLWFIMHSDTYLLLYI